MTPLVVILGLVPSEGPLTLFLLTYNWADEADDDAVIAAAQKLISDIDDYTQSKGGYNQFKYLNYAASWQNPFQGYGETNVQNLQDVSKKYDPFGIFQRNCPGGFKISQA